jgi:hypothetical protein
VRPVIANQLGTPVANTFLTIVGGRRRDSSTQLAVVIITNSSSVSSVESAVNSNAANPAALTSALRVSIHLHTSFFHHGFKAP